MKQDGSKFVVYAALAGNLAIAATKLGAATFTGSCAMFTEAIHSFVDTGNQGLILYGMRRAARPAYEVHPFGHGLELYFWSFVVALLIFALGGAFAIYEGIERIRHPEMIESVWVNFAVIGVSMVFEGLSFRVAWREMRARFADIPIWTAMRRSKDPSTFAVLLEDGAALLGLAIALLVVGASVYLDEARADGIASVAIGALLINTVRLRPDRRRYQCQPARPERDIGEGVIPALLCKSGRHRQWARLVGHGPRITTPERDDL